MKYNHVKYGLKGESHVIFQSTTNSPADSPSKDASTKVRGHEIFYFFNFSPTVLNLGIEAFFKPNRGIFLDF